MIDFYEKIIEPLLTVDSVDLRKTAFLLENHKPSNEDDNLFRNARLAAAETLNRLARVQDFADFIFSDEPIEESNQ